MKLLLKDIPVMEISQNGSCKALDFDRLPFALRRENVGFADFMEWAAARVLPIGRSYAKEILNVLHLSQNNRYAVCKACRGLTLNDAYWIREDSDSSEWRSANLYRNPLTLFMTEVSLSGTIEYHLEDAKKWNRQMATIHTPELMTMGVNAKGWIRQTDGIYLHKIGKCEIPAHEILTALGVRHIPYYLSDAGQTAGYITRERSQWIESVGEKIVHSRIFTSEETGFVTFEEFRVFCGNRGQDAYEEAARIDRAAYAEMQIADYILNNDDRHGQNWGFLLDNDSAQIIGFCPLFDHDHAFSAGRNVLSQTAKENMTLKEAALSAWQEKKLDLYNLFHMPKPSPLTDKQWQGVLDRAGELEQQL